MDPPSDAPAEREYSGPPPARGTVTDSRIGEFRVSGFSCPARRGVAGESVGVCVGSGFLALPRVSTFRGGTSSAFARVALAFEHLRPHLERRPLLVSSKGVGRILNTLLGGTERMAVANGEIVEFAVAPNAGESALRVTRSYLA